jgi:hypothetical protein
MNDWNTNWLILNLALERQQRLLREAGLDHALHRASLQNQTLSARALGFSGWVAHVFGLRRRERSLER